MEHEEIRVIIAKKGFITCPELIDHFGRDQEELLMMNLNFLRNKNKIRKALYQSPDGPSILYYVLPE